MRRCRTCRPPSLSLVSPVPCGSAAKPGVVVVRSWAVAAAAAALLCRDAAGQGQAIALSSSDCWHTCRQYGHFCEVFCCQAFDGIGNPTCWDLQGHFTFERCCLDPLVRALADPPEPPEPPKLRIGSLTLPLYRGPSDYNSPKVNERTVEIALGLWFMHRCLERLHQLGGGVVPIEIGNTLANYWPREERLFGRVMPWQVFDLGDNGQDATHADFSGVEVLSISTIEHIGYDNEGARRTEGFRIGASDTGIEAWMRSWDAAPELLMRIVEQAERYLITWPVGFNPHLDATVARIPKLQAHARVVRRLDAANTWDVDPNTSFAYGYDLRDTYGSEFVGYMYDPVVWRIYERVFGQAIPHPPRPLPMHPPFRFANAVCVVTNMPQLLA
mmetsp:Transcript_77619/g.209813  ORF Transcript_77619/g.209813 Transcript_77619/m.209813 type:complete len:386 (-) Transcript_77619:37-1194(-)